MSNIPDQSWSINAQLHSWLYPLNTDITIEDKDNILTNFNRFNERFCESGHRFYEESLKLQMQLLILEMRHTFANELNITPKYLNHLSKIHSGITASEWMQRYTKERIILLLQNKNFNISEIADEMDFSSRSFFTR